MSNLNDYSFTSFLEVNFLPGSYVVWVEVQDRYGVVIVLLRIDLKAYCCVSDHRLVLLVVNDTDGKRIGHLRSY